MEIGFYHGCLSDSYEEQANKQGFTLGDKKEYYKNVKESFNYLVFGGFLTESEIDKVCKRIQKKLVNDIKENKHE